MQRPIYNDIPNTVLTVNLTVLQLGPLYEYGVCRSHHFCLMFSSGLEQKGEEEEGIMVYRFLAEMDLIWI